MTTNVSAEAETAKTGKDKEAERAKFLEVLKKFSQFSDDTLNLDLPLARDPDYQKKHMEMLLEFTAQGAKLYDLPQEEHERMRQNIIHDCTDNWPTEETMSLEHWKKVIIKNAGFNSKRILEKLVSEEGDFDCSNVKLSQTIIVPPGQRIYGKKVRRKTPGQRQVAMEVQSYGIMSKKILLEDFLDTKKPFVIVSGVAGSGKSVLMRELPLQYYDLKEFSVGGLSSFKVVIRYECRNKTVTTYEELVEFNFPGMCGHLGTDFVAGVIADLDVLYLVDGYDEVSQVSELILRDVIEFTRNTKDSKVVFSTRPHAVQMLKEFLKNNKSTEADVEIFNLSC